MKDFFKTAIEFTKNIGKTGAISESSRFVEKEITRNIDKNKPQFIVEFGGGHGNITKEILQKMHPQSTLITFELEAPFIEILSQIPDSRLQVIHASAENLLSYVMPASVDCIISSLPLTILPKALGKSILANSIVALKEGGSFHQFLYTIRLDKFKDFFEKSTIKPVINFPPAFVYHSVKK